MEQDQIIAESEVMFYEDGTLNEAFLIDNFGIGAEEAMQEVAFGAYTGTVAQMLADERCPVGDMVRTAYHEQGIEGVAEKFKALGEMDPKFQVQITDTTRQRELNKINTPEPKPKTDDTKDSTGAGVEANIVKPTTGKDKASDKPSSPSTKSAEREASEHNLLAKIEALNRREQAERQTQAAKRATPLAKAESLPRPNAPIIVETKTIVENSERRPAGITRPGKRIDTIPPPKIIKPDRTSEQLSNQPPKLETTVIEPDIKLESIDVVPEGLNTVITDENDLLGVMSFDEEADIPADDSAEIPLELENLFVDYDAVELATPLDDFLEPGPISTEAADNQIYPVESLQSELATLPEVARQIVENLALAEPEQAKEIIAIIKEIAQLSKDIYLLRMANHPEAPQTEENLVELCSHLLESLGMNSADEAVMAFIQSVVLAETQQDVIETPWDIFEAGTHEQKFGDQSLMSQLIRLLNRQLLPLNLLGKFALQLHYYQ